MNRVTNRKLLDEWLEKHGPDAISALAYKSRVSAGTIQRARASEVAPKKLSTLQRISETMGVKVEDLFPLATTNGKAS